MGANGGKRGTRVGEAGGDVRALGGVCMRVSAQSAFAESYLSALHACMSSHTPYRTCMLLRECSCVSARMSLVPNLLQAQDAHTHTRTRVRRIRLPPPPPRTIHKNACRRARTCEHTQRFHRRHTPPTVPLLRLGCAHAQVQARLQQFSGEQLVGMMEALARLRYVPGPDWLADFERASQSKLTTEVSAGGLATIVWALAQVCEGKGGGGAAQVGAGTCACWCRCRCGCGCAGRPVALAEAEAEAEQYGC